MAASANHQIDPGTGTFGASPQEALNGATIILRIDSVSGVRSIRWRCTGTQAAADTVASIQALLDAGLGGSPTGQTATITIPAGIAKAFGFELQVNNGVDESGDTVANLTQTSGLYVLNSATERPFFVGETFEENATHGTTERLNTALDGGAGAAGSLAATLAIGQVTGGLDIQMSSGDDILGLGAGTDHTLGFNAVAPGTGGDWIINGQAAGASGAGGGIQLVGQPGGATTGIGGPITRVAGAATAGDNSGGLISDTTGAGSGDGAGGAWLVTLGVGGVTNASGGPWTVNGGTGGGASGTGTTIVLNTGASPGASGTAGDFIANLGNPNGGTGGTFRVQSNTTNRALITATATTFNTTTFTFQDGSAVSNTFWNDNLAVFGQPGFQGSPGSGAGAGFGIAYIGGTGGATDGTGGPTVVAGGGGGGSDGPGGLLTLGGGVPTGSGTPGLINMALGGVTFASLDPNYTDFFTGRVITLQSVSGGSNVGIVGVTPGAGQADSLFVRSGTSVAGSTGSSVTVQAGDSTTSAGGLNLNAGAGTGAGGAGGSWIGAGGASTGAAPAGGSTFRGGNAAGSGSGGTATVAGGTSGSGTPGNVVAQVAGNNKAVFSPTSVAVHDTGGSVIASLLDSIAVFSQPGWAGVTGSGAGAGGDLVYTGGTGGPTDGAGGPVIVAGGGGGGSDGDGGLLTLGGGIATGSGTDGNVNIAIGGVTRITTTATNVRISVPVIRFEAAVVAPVIRQLQDTGTDATGDLMTIHAQDVAGGGTTITGGALTVRAGNASGAATTDIGGALTLASGTGTDTNGEVSILTGATEVIQLASGQVRFKPVGTTRFQVSDTILDLFLTTFRFASTVSAPILSPQTDTGTDATGDLMTIHAQDVSGSGTTITGGGLTVRAGNASGAATNDVGGNLTLAAGTGTTTDGQITMQAAGGTTGVWTGGGLTLFVPVLTFDTSEVSPEIRQNTDSAGGGTGDLMTIHAQDVDGGSGTITGGKMLIRGGNAAVTAATTEAGGAIEIATGGGAESTGLGELTAGGSTIFAWDQDSGDGSNSRLAFFAASMSTKRAVTGARDDPEAALANLLTELAAYGLITDSTTAT